MTPSKPEPQGWEEEFDKYEVDRWGKWRIGRAEAKAFIRQLLEERTESQPTLVELDENEVRRVLDEATPTGFDGMQNYPTHGMARAICAKFGRPQAVVDNE